MNFELDFPAAYGGPLARANLKASPQDFIVEETLSFPLSGQGEHLYLYLRKTNANTEWVSQQLARQLSVPHREIGYAGLKDRHGVTAQWFSLPARNITPARLDALQIEGVEICEAVNHTRKLRKGAIRHNRFSICLRELRVAPSELRQRLELISQQGFPNYFDEQRFGRQRSNLSEAQRMFLRQIKPSRFQRGLYLSAARAWLFNLILARRVWQQTWRTMMTGDVYWLDGTRRFFVPEIYDAEIEQRLAQGDIHPTGALWGDGALASGADVAQLETAVTAEWPLLMQGLVDARLTQDRRPLRVIPGDLSHDYDAGEGCLQLCFTLPAGAYATALLREVIVPQTAQADNLN